MTRTAQRILPLILTIGLIITGLDQTTPAPLAADTFPEPVVLTAPEADILEASITLFEIAGLELPDDIVVSFHGDTEPCRGNLGLSTEEDGVSRVRVCWSHENPGVEARLQTQALVHELAHVWVGGALDDEAKAAFVEFSGAETWRHVDTEWNDRGTERAADLITWALLDPAVLFVDFSDMSCQTWAPAYELLTRTPAPAPLSDAC